MCGHVMRDLYRACVVNGEHDMRVGQTGSGARGEGRPFIYTFRRISCKFVFEFPQNTVHLFSIHSALFNSIFLTPPRPRGSGVDSVQRNVQIENRPGFFRRLVTWPVQLPMRGRIQYTAPILREIEFVNSLRQYSLEKAWNYPLNHTGPPRHHATLGACPGTPPVRCCAAHAFPLPPLSGAAMYSYRGNLG